MAQRRGECGHGRLERVAITNLDPGDTTHVARL
jgi:hypothetical protein